MKLEHTQYLELVIRHKDSVVTEFPSRFCVIRIPLEKFVLEDSVSIKFRLYSIGQIRKIISIGFFDSPKDYLISGHRPFDESFISVNDVSFDFLYNQVFYCKDLYKNYLAL